MNKAITVHLEWTYTPKNYLENPVEIKDKYFALSIDDGLALAKIDLNFFRESTDIKNYLTSLIENHLSDIQIMSHRKYNLSEPNREDCGEHGSKNTIIEVESTKMALSSATLDFVVKDKDGNVVSDTKRDRVNKQKRLANLIEKYRNKDQTLNKMLNSYRMAVNNPENELVYLYEIRDALSSRFGNKKNAINKLCIDKNDWSKLGELANNKPLKEGRHRGKVADELRAAGDSELKVARKISSDWIEKYLDFLETEENP